MNMSNIKAKKIVLIGAGAVGTSFLFAAINRSIATEFDIIDAFPDASEGNALDFEDTIATSPNSFNVKVGRYKDCKNADLIVITAGRPSKPGETRLDLLSGNAQIMKNIATEVKKSGFNGVTLIASNPVDVLSAVYRKVTGFSKNLVISSGTSLDSARLKFEIGKRINISPKSISAYVMGEHGDSSVSIFSGITANGILLSKFEKNKEINPKEYDLIHKFVYEKAGIIISKKRITNYGIGSSLADIADIIINDRNEIRAVGAYLEGEYGNSGAYAGVPALINKKGIVKVLEIDLNSKEKQQFDKSFKVLKEYTDKILKTV